VNAMVVGDRRKFIAALIVPNSATVSSKAAERGLQFASNADMAKDPFVVGLIEQEVKRLTGNLAQYETIKRFALLPEDFTFDNGSLTFTLKLKRRVVEQRYREIIDGLYADAEEPRPVAQD
jgi:long-chain acyl-CoA synthetase